MREALHIFKKDSRYLRVPILIVLAWLGLFVYASVPTLALYDLRPWAFGGFAFSIMGFAPYVLGLGWCYLIARAVHADALHGDRQFWLTRPHDRRALFLAKLLFVTAYVAVPLGLAQAAILVMDGLPLAPQLPALLWSLALTMGLMAAPMLAFSATTASIGSLIATLVPVPIILSALVQSSMGLGAFSWARLSTASLLMLVVVPLVLWLQFGRRRTRLSQLTMLIGVLVAFPVVNLVDFDSAFRLQQLLASGSEPTLSASLDLPRRSSSAMPLPNRQFQLRFTLAGPPPDTLVSCEGAQVTIMSQSGSHLRQPTRPVLGGRLTRVQDGCTTFVILPQDADPLLAGPVAIDATLYVTTFEGPSRTSLPDGNLRYVPDYGKCLAANRSYQETEAARPLYTYVNITCDTVFREPRVAASFKAGDEESVFYRPNYSPWPAVLRLQPIERIGRTYRFRTDDTTSSVTTRAVAGHVRLAVHASNVDLKAYQVLEPHR